MMAMALIAVGVTASAAESAAPPTPQAPKASRSGFLPVNGLKLYYEVYGDLAGSTTAPLLFMPGSFQSTAAAKPWVAAFAAKRPVIVFDPQGHGRTADTSRKMSYEQFADDAAALLTALKVERADVMGYSQGGGVGLRLAVRHPKLVNKLVCISAAYRKDGWHPAVSRALAAMNAKDFAGSPIEAAFRKHNPDPRAFQAYIANMRELSSNERDISDAQMRAISARTMIIVGDADAVKPEHALAMFRLRGGGDDEAAATGKLTKVPAARLVILPATSHIAISSETRAIEAMVTPFLDDALPANPELLW
jgi:pimeloyl-ACP methyl ester carboxylesterase